MMLDGTEIRFDDVYTEMITVAEHLEPTGADYTITQGDQKIKLSDYCMQELIKACKYFIKTEN